MTTYSVSVSEAPGHHNGPHPETSSWTATGSSPQAACEALSAMVSATESPYASGVVVPSGGWTVDSTVCDLTYSYNGYVRWTGAITGGGAEPPSGGSSAPSGSGVSVTCTVSPCTVAVTYDINTSLPDAAGGAQIAGAILAVWALGWAVRQFILMLRNVDGDSSTNERE